MASSSRLRRNITTLRFRQRRRLRPSLVKTAVVTSLSPSERLQMALDLSDFCLALREARTRKR